MSRRNWNALNASCSHPSFRDPEVEQTAKQKSKTSQYSEELIYIIDSADVEVTTTETQVALSIQAALQAAIAIIVNISIADSQKADQVAQELFQNASVRQTNRQKTFIKNSRGVRVTTTDTDIAVNIQVLIQVLLALLVKVDLL
ncbi:MAG TPA: spore coat protein [Pseudoneobacillus sp.]|nr:spore coat protein [Pseudoneobacillus sp.]